MNVGNPGQQVSHHAEDRGERGASRIRTGGRRTRQTTTKTQPSRGPNQRTSRAPRQQKYSSPRRTRQAHRNRRCPERLTIKHLAVTLAYFTAKIQGTLNGIPDVPLVIQTYETTSIIKDQGEPDDAEYIEPLNPNHSSIDLNACSSRQLEQFRYVKLCEMWQEEDDRDLNWTPIQIMRHFVNKNNPDDVHVCVKVSWLNGETSIQRLLPFRHRAPRSCRDLRRQQ